MINFPVVLPVLGQKKMSQAALGVPSHIAELFLSEKQQLLKVTS